MLLQRQTINTRTRARGRVRTEIVPSNPLKADPTRTATLRRLFQAEFTKRFNRLKGRILRLIVDEDSFGLTLNAPWRFATNPQKVILFNNWLKEQTDSIILENATAETVEDAYWNRYIQDGYRKGAGRAFDDTRKFPGFTPEEGAFFQGTKQEFLRQSFAQPVSLDKVKLLTGRVFTELNGIVPAMAQRLTRELTDGLVQGQNPREIARSINKAIDGIGKVRSRMLARTEIIRAHAEGQLDALEELGVEEVGVAVEWSTAGDGRVCRLCAPMGGVVFKIKDARGMIPRHPNCRCAHIPANVGESTVGQKRSKTEIDKAIGQSLKAEIPKRSKRTIAEQRSVSQWAGADKTIGKRRPKSVLDPTKQGKFGRKPLSPQLRSERGLQPKKPKPTAPKPVAPKVPSLEERISKNQAVKEIRRKVLASEVDTEKLGRAVSRMREAHDELQKLSNKGASLYLEGDITIAERKIEVAKINKSISILEDKRKSAIKEIQKLKFDASREIENSLSVDVKKRVKLSVNRSNRITTTDLDNKIFRTLDSNDRRFIERSKDAEQFVTRLTESTKEINVNSHLMPKTKRAFHRGGNSPESGIHLAEDALPKTYVHEIGHRIEKEILNAEKLANEFLEMRIARSKTKTVKMSDVCPDCNYGPDEFGNQDDWVKLFGKDNSYYVGKSYTSGHTEIISMGLERLFEDPVGMAKIDPEYFDFLIGLLRGVL